MRYQPCEKVVTDTLEYCGRPVPRYPKPKGQYRCELHPPRRIWPGTDGPQS